MLHVARPAKYLAVCSLVLIIAAILYHNYYINLSEKGNKDTMSAAKTYVDGKVKDGKVVVFSKSYCPYCKKVKDTLKKAVKPDSLDVIELDDGRPDMDAIMDYLKTLTGARTVPRVFIAGKSIGGNDDTQRIANNGELKKMLTPLDAAL